MDLLHNFETTALIMLGFIQEVRYSINVDGNLLKTICNIGGSYSDLH